MEGSIKSASVIFLAVECKIALSSAKNKLQYQSE